MTLLPDWPVTLSSLGEASISYPQQVIRRLVGVGSSIVQRSPSSGEITSDSLLLYIDELLSSPLSTSTVAALSLTVFAGILAIVAMSWRDTFGFFRRSPSYGSQNMPPATPQVNDSDFTYLTNDDIIDPPRPHQQSHEGRRRAQTGADYADDSGPDIVLLKHRGVTYPLHFPPYAIDDGDLTVGEIRRRAAEKTGTSDVQRIRILYKGKLLRDDARPCKDEGLKQQSEVMCVVSEVRPSISTSDISGSEGGSRSEALSLDSRNTDHLHQSPPSGGGGGGEGAKRKRNKKKKRHQQAPGQRLPETVTSANDNLAPPSDIRPTSSGRSSAAPSPAPSLQQYSTGNEKVDALLRYLRTELAPMCDKYFSQPPTDPKVRDFEHKRLSEMILAQVILKADSIDSEDARIARRALIKEAQGLLNKLDDAAPHKNR